MSSNLTGPFPETVCHLDLIMKNVIIMKIQTFQAATIIVRYIFTFRIKNPTAVHDKFWNRCYKTSPCQFNNASPNATTLRMLKIHLI
jgi:hypothetical protein